MEVFGPASPGGFSRDVGRLIEQVADQDFYQRLFEFLGEHWPYSSGHVLKYNETDAPRVLFVGDDGNYDLLDEYLSGFYLFDPLLDHIGKDNFSNDVYVLNEIAPKNFSESGYFSAHYEKASIVDEIGWIFHPTKGDFVVICLMRRWQQTKFQPAQRKLARLVHPIIGSLISLHENNAVTGFKATMSGSRTVSIQNTEQSKCEEDTRILQLSDRQKMITDLILGGRSTEQIAETLGISAGTVKTHKKNIYARLGVSSKGELFNHFLRSSTG
ncbi:helix-turn-helix transcriptional regulator [Agrobacterium sp. NPDC090283]|uniref:helix-turn-helix transcriptional regulator n=1 Tax=Agrobacterium sp. NPDC090283 TaxID=3363920 RepID=UPI00383B8EA5